MPRHANQLLAALGGLCLSFSLIACGPPTLAGAEARYTGNRDKLSAVITRKPQAKAEIEAKLAEFAAEYEKALKETPEEKKIAAIGALSSITYGPGAETVRVVVIDGTSALDLGTAKAQARERRPLEPIPPP